MSKGDVVELRDRTTKLIFVLREGSPPITWNFNGLEFEETLGDGKLLGYFSVKPREWHVPNG